MKKLFEKIRNYVNTNIAALAAFLSWIVFSAFPSKPRLLKGRAGEGYIDTAVKILIAVVLGALLLAGLYALFNDTVMPTVTQKIKDMFSYSGTLS